jgi:hypothetical protein
MEQLTHWKKLTNPDYIGAYALQPGEEKVVEIISVGRQKVKGTNGQEQECTVAILKGEKPFILNRTNCKTLTKIYGTPFIEQWTGKRITVYAEKVNAFGDTVEALRIRPTEPQLPVLNPKSPKWSGAVQALKDGKVTIEAIERQYRINPEDRELLLTESI